MGKEFEAKVLLTPDEYIAILEQEVGDTMSSVTKAIKKSDVYYSKYAFTAEAIKNNESLTRIRTEDDKTYLTLKKKELTDGFENNEECETLVEDVEVVKKFLLEAGYSPYFKKYKTSHTIYVCPSPMSIPGVEVNVELERVENSKHTEKSTYKRLYALEIEAVAPSMLNVSTEKLAEVVKAYFSYFNKTEEDFDTRSWRELLS